jgi:hypothetical protein
VQKGFWMLLPYDEVKGIPGLRPSPSMGGGDPTKLAPVESMQSGKANERLWQTIMSANPKFGPLHMNKIDISNGFYTTRSQPWVYRSLEYVCPPLTDYLLWLHSRWSCHWVGPNRPHNFALSRRPVVTSQTPVYDATADPRDTASRTLPELETSNQVQTEDPTYT